MVLTKPLACGPGPELDAVIRSSLLSEEKQGSLPQRCFAANSISATLWGPSVDMHRFTPASPGDQKLLVGFGQFLRNRLSTGSTQVSSMHQGLRSPPPCTHASVRKNKPSRTPARYYRVSKESHAVCIKPMRSDLPPGCH